MPFCPKCRYEYNWGVNVCPDCDEKLVDRLPSSAAQKVPHHDEWVSVCILHSDMTTEIVKGALDSNNIPSMVINSMYSALGKGVDLPAGLLGEGGGGVCILVPQEFKEEAEVIVEAVVGEDENGDDDRDQSQRPDSNWNG